MSSFDGAYANKLDNKVKRFAVDLVVEDLITKKKTAHAQKIVP